MVWVASTDRRSHLSWRRWCWKNAGSVGRISLPIWILRAISQRQATLSQRWEVGVYRSFVTEGDKNSGSPMANRKA